MGDGTETPTSILTSVERLEAPVTPLNDDELVELALAADPDAALDADAVPLEEYLLGSEGLLPPWYMPAPRGRVRSRWQVAVLVLVIVSFLVIDGFGLCATYGQLVTA